MKPIHIIFCLLLVTMVSCNKKTKDTDTAKLNQLADRMCRAITMRQQRFTLANNIRFSQDTLHRTKNKADSARLQQKLTGYLKEKVVITAKSLSLADTIKMQLDSLLPVTDKAAQNRFTKSLDSILKKKGCQ